METYTSNKKHKSMALLACILVQSCAGKIGIYP